MTEAEPLFLAVEQLVRAIAGGGDVAGVKTIAVALLPKTADYEGSDWIMGRLHNAANHVNDADRYQALARAFSGVDQRDRRTVPISGTCYAVDLLEPIAEFTNGCEDTAHANANSVIRQLVDYERGDPAAAPRTCILTGAEGENPEDCTTHEHEED